MLKELRERVALGLIKEVVHPKYPELSLFNYTQVCQFEQAWDEYTMMARGIVLNTNTGEVVARPFKKFFNLSQHEPEEIPSVDPLVFEMMDGSLGIVFHYAGKWHVATRGSFTSEQAVWAMDWLSKQDKSELFHNETYLVEIIYPKNRIVVDHGGLESLVLLGVYRNEVYELSSSEYHLEYYKTSNWQPLAIVHKKPFKSNLVKQIGRVSELPTEGENQKGFVLWWPASDFRVKVKFESYNHLKEYFKGTPYK